ncbi:MOSC domain-containing protein YiiM [Silvibacterium bohemicum]|uniref:MOSC domain-containing protein YiiM n=1 Tax=Silvibacterium bohemicum TaxID=1577686 RepID=A0A841K3T6_9BACT|nr:MOSC domain-containing protein [Silvibacterium bohemicum]MBB6145298.1 MOSC domain-containing protein YiiM [Silvibacterium bohemicum]
MHASSQYDVQSVNVSGALRDVEFAGQTIRTGYFKQPVGTNVSVYRLGLEGDVQADRTVHGGADKAVYFYPHEHYAGWEVLLGSGPLPAGSFGENITTNGLTEEDVCIGDVLRIGSALLQVTQPRSPCYKLQIKFQRPDIVALFVRRGLPGWYASVLREGSLGPGDVIEVVSRAPERISVADIWKYSFGMGTDADMQRQMMELTALPMFWKRRIAQLPINEFA